MVGIFAVGNSGIPGTLKRESNHSDFLGWGIFRFGFCAVVRFPDFASILLGLKHGVIHRFGSGTEVGNYE